MRLIDADALIEIFDKDEYERVRNEYQSGYNDGLLHAEVVADDLADNMPTVDAVPVVRCKDCKYAIKLDRLDLPWLTQWDYSCKYYNMHFVMGDDYCSRAERKEE